MEYVALSTWKKRDLPELPSWYYLKIGGKVWKAVLGLVLVRCGTEHEPI